jgi:ABA sandwich protein
MPQHVPPPDECVERVRIGSLKQLDALIGERLTKETPRTHWEDANTHFQFGSVEEALDALCDPFLRQFLPHTDSKPTILTEIKEFRRYSSDLNTAWLVVEQLSGSLEVGLLVRRDRQRWIASFGAGNSAVASTATLAICIAALRMNGIEVEFVGEDLRGETGGALRVDSPILQQPLARP